MPEKIAILNPEAEAWRPGAITIPHVAGLTGATVAILNNRWTSMDIIAQQIGIILKEDYGVSDVIQKPIPLASAAPEELLDDIASRAQAAIVGLAN